MIYNLILFQCILFSNPSTSITNGANTTCLLSEDSLKIESSVFGIYEEAYKDFINSKYPIDIFLINITSGKYQIFDTLLRVFEDSTGIRYLKEYSRIDSTVSIVTTLNIEIVNQIKKMVDESNVGKYIVTDHNSIARFFKLYFIKENSKMTFQLFLGDDSDFGCLRIEDKVKVEKSMKLIKYISDL